MAWHAKVIVDGFIEPIKITLAVLISGVLFRFFQNRIEGFVKASVKALGIKTFVLVMVIGLGVLSSVITAIIAYAAPCGDNQPFEIRQKKRNSDGCFFVLFNRIGGRFDAGRRTACHPCDFKAQRDPFHAGFWFLTGNLWVFIIPALLITGLTSLFFIPHAHTVKDGLSEDRRESYKDIFMRTIKVYFFIMALIFLGQGFKPIIDSYISQMPVAILYWINSVSAILDNATLTAAEIGPSMSLMQINSALLGLLIAGGMLIPGNIPNIISAGKLKIGSGEWARIGLPAGLILMMIYFPVILFVQSFVK